MTTEIIRFKDNLVLQFSRWEHRGMSLGFLVSLLAILVYGNSLWNGFVWDDDAVILNNAMLQRSALSLFSGLDFARSTDLIPYYRPLTLLSFLAEQRLHGLNPFGVRLFNVLLHSLNTFLVFQLARTLFSRPQTAMLVALLFAVHPIQAEAVDFNAGGRNTLLACFFVLSTYLLHLKSITTGRLKDACAGALLFLTGLLSKELAFTVLLPIILLELSSQRRTEHILQTVQRLAPYLVSAVIYFVLRGNALSHAGIQANYLPDLLAFLQNNVFILPRYLLNVVLPGWLSAYYFIPDDLNLFALPLFFSWIFIIAMITWLLTRGRSRAALFGLMWAFAFWIPTSGIIPFSSAALADRYVYISAIGIWIVVADQCTTLLAGHKALEGRLSIIVVAIVLALFAITTVKRNQDWRDDISLFTGVISLYPGKAWGYHNLGCAYLDKVKNTELAERAFAKALSLDPSFPLLQTQMGYVRLLKGDFAGALLHYDEAVRLNTNDGEAHLNRAIVLESLGRFAEALSEYQRFLDSTGNQLPASWPMAEAKVRYLSQYIEK